MFLKDGEKNRKILCYRFLEIRLKRFNDPMIPLSILLFQYFSQDHIFKRLLADGKYFIYLLKDNLHVDCRYSEKLFVTTQGNF